MRTSIKLIPILLLGSALSGCSGAGFGDLFGGKKAQGQLSQAGQYWGGAQSACQQALPCNTAYAPAPQTAVQYGSPAPQTYGQSYGQTYGQAVPYQQGVQSQPVYQGQPVYQEQPVYQGQPIYQGQQGQVIYQGQQPFQPTGYAPAYVTPNARPSKGLRPAYTYGTLGATLYDVDNSIFGAQARLGYQSSFFLGAEIEGSFGFSDDDDTVTVGTGFVETETGVDTQIAGFGVARFPVTKQFNVLGRVGYHNTEVDVEIDDGTGEIDQDFSDDGIAYGAGIEYAFTNEFGVRVDYTRYAFDGPDADAVSLAVTRKF